MTDGEVNAQVAAVFKPKPPSYSDMQFYYKYLYPFKSIFTWLNHSPKPGRDIINREFAMSFRSGAYKRYNSYNSVQEFKNQIVKANPDRFEIGAVYNKPPQDRDSLLKSDMVPLEKELIFDIDMDDYDTFRTCCSGAQVCDKCWKFISLAMKIMETVLVDDFGYEVFFWVFSGRRGAHCWVSDRRARTLNDLQRRNVLDYVNVVKDRSAEKRIALKRPYHPHLARSLEQLKPFFTEIILDEQNPWQNDEHAVQTLLPGLHDKNLVQALTAFWKENPGRTSKEKWSDIDVIASKELKITKKQEFAHRLRECKEDMVIATLYPKLDIEVTKQTIHLLKAPFCVHPATGNVCVPIDEKFTPADAPKLLDLQNEMELNGGDVTKTALQPYLEAFQKRVNQVVKQDVSNMKRSREKTDAQSYEF